MAVKMLVFYVVFPCGLSVSEELATFIFSAVLFLQTKPFLVCMVSLLTVIVGFWVKIPCNVVHGVITQKTAIQICTTMRGLNVTSQTFFVIAIRIVCIVIGILGMNSFFINIPFVHKFLYSSILTVFCVKAALCDDFCVKYRFFIRAWY